MNAHRVSYYYWTPFMHDSVEMAERGDYQLTQIPEKKFMYLFFLYKYYQF